MVSVVQHYFVLCGVLSSVHRDLGQHCPPWKGLVCLQAGGFHDACGRGHGCPLLLPHTEL